MNVLVGTSGWQYYHWIEKFYPKDLKSKDFLKLYSKYFKTVEINTTFYHFTRKETFLKWRGEVSNKNFIFAIKLHRFFTHLKKLNLKKEDQKILEDFLKNLSVLEDNLGPLLIQLPPSFKNEEKLKNFIKLFKKISKSVFKKYPQIAVEIRNKNLLNPKIYKFFKKEGIAFVISDSLKWPTDIIKTTNFVYVRFHGKPQIFSSKYSEEELKDYAQKIKKLKPKILYAYFNNDALGHAISNAFEFKKILGEY
jgi:uncharacterized protein YecE (DUF72 family)